jgi:hypothetical protein
MSYRVHIEDHFVTQGYRVWLVEQIGDLRRLLTHDRRYVLRTDEATNIPPESNDYFADIPYDAAHALLGALSRQLGAVEHPEQLRRDFEHERTRVDKFIDATIARIFP